jgi:COP9 signalosome complex subunit 2
VCLCARDTNVGKDYESNDGDEPDVDLENQYYNAKQLKEDNPHGALTAFEKVHRSFIS